MLSVFTNSICRSGTAEVHCVPTLSGKDWQTIRPLFQLTGEEIDDDDAAV
jgi:hypothetical protein